jgi:branched-chain amino acid transport system substrate-binding protein
MAATTAAGCTEAVGSPLVIAADLEVTGPGAERGAVHEQALRLRVAQVNQQRLAGGRQVLLRVSDNRSDPAVAAANLAAHAADPQVAAVVTGGCLPCVTEFAAALEGVPTISLAAGPQVSEPIEARRWLFQLAPDAADNANLIAARIAADGIDTVAVVAADDPYGRAGADALAEAAAFDGIHIASSDLLAPGADTQVQQTVQAITGLAEQAAADPLTGPPLGGGVVPAAAPVQAVVLWTGPTQAVQVAAGLRDAGWDGLLYLDTVAADELFLAGGHLDGARLVATNTLVADSLIAGSIHAAARKQWLAEYVAVHGTYHLHASLAADAINIIIDATNRAAGRDRAGGLDRTALREAIETTRGLPGLTGTIRFSRDQHSGLHPNSLTILTAGNGRWLP